MNTDEITGMTLERVAAAIRSKHVSSVEVTQRCLDRVDTLASKVNGFISVERDEVLKAAEAADDALRQGAVCGPLHGVPLAHKDMFYRKGKVSTCGSKIMRDQVQNVTSTVLERLGAAGALYMGSLHMSEFAAGPTGHNDHYGPCRNPWNLDHITGGSSSGSGASVASRFTFGAMGSDTGGSVRLPAGLCGVVGLKPTHGRISRFGALPRSWTNDAMGPIARTVRDCALMTSLIAGEDPKDPTTFRTPLPDYDEAMAAGIRGITVGVPANQFYDDVDGEIGTALEESISVLERQGARIVKVAVPDLGPHYRLGDAITKCESATIHGKWIRERPQDYGRVVLSRIEVGFHIPATRYLEAISLRGRYLSEFLEAVFDKVDVLHAPLLPVPVPTIKEKDYTGSADVPESIASMTKLTRPSSFLGLPTLSVPCGFSRGNLPIAFQLIGRPFREADLFATGLAYEQVTGWTEASPSL